MRFPSPPSRAVGDLHRRHLQARRRRGQTHQGQLVWAVLAATRERDAGDLAGSYYGVNAEASVVTGGGANLLVGGLDSAFMLEPLSVQAQTGINLAVAVTSLELIHSLK
ncbi:DUF992 domain-containing protein [Mesorhizobium sp. B4-1-4]|uniref:DUF992 domain-containing protein n=1 Tax=Mesorhizobium sp. B4-1-4 TaxID=2589888 RepID=UPI0021F7971D|nr:DUF992 domain-containing protein [Mesorhizobium sp. B4-1-4]